MFRPLLRSIPTISGNVKLVCLLEDFDKISNNTYECYIRSARLAPLSSNLFTKYLPISLINSSYEWDLKDFYGYYSDIFWEEYFSYNKYDLPIFNRHSNNLTRNIDFEYGCKRISYQKNGYQLGFYAPIYIDNVNDIPDKFVIKLKIKNSVYTTERYININIGKNKDNKGNYLYNYLYRYINKIDDNVIYVNSNNKNANYYGIDIKNGGFSIKTDNEVNKIFVKQNTIQNFDHNLCLGFKRCNLVMKQIIPLCFYFNINDLIKDSKYEYKKYINSEIYISGYWTKDEYNSKNESIENIESFYDWDYEYNNYNLPVKTLNYNLGNMNYSLDSSKNIMNMDYPALNEGNYINYRLSNVINKHYVRWKLKYSSDENPYIINMSPAFSMNQNSQIKYGEFPITFTYTNGIVDNGFTDNDGVPHNNLLLPFNRNSSIYNSLNLLYKYNDYMNNYISNWFECINLDSVNSIEDVIKNNIFNDVFDNKTFYNGILYNFNNINNYENISNKNLIDKFGVFLTLKYNPVTDENLYKLKYSNVAFIDPSNKFSNFSNVRTNLYNNIKFFLSDKNKQLYNLSLNKNVEQRNNELFIINTNNDGKFIDVKDYGIDYNDINNFYLFNEIKQYIYNESNKYKLFIDDFYYGIINSIKQDYPDSDIKTITDNKKDLTILSLLNDIIDKIFKDSEINDIKHKLYKKLDISYLENIFIANEDLVENKAEYEYELSLLNKNYKNDYVNDLFNADANKLKNMNLYYSISGDSNKTYIGTYDKLQNLIKTYISNNANTNKNKINIYLFQHIDFISQQDLINDILIKIYNYILYDIIIDYTYINDKKITIDHVKKYISDDCEYNLFNISYNLIYRLSNSFDTNDRLSKYIYHPFVKNEYNAYECVDFISEVLDVNQKFYGDELPSDKQIYDLDFIYIDPYNYNQLVDEYNNNNFDNCAYLKNDDNYLYHKYYGNFYTLNILNLDKKETKDNKYKLDIENIDNVKNNCNAIDYYCKFFNFNHLRLFFKKLYNNANCNKDDFYDYDPYSIFDTVFVRKKISYVDDNYDNYCNIKVTDMYIPISEYFIIDRKQDIVTNKNIVLEYIQTLNTENKTVYNRTVGEAFEIFINKQSIDKQLTLKSDIYNKIDKEQLNYYLIDGYNDDVTDEWFVKDIKNEDLLIIKNDYLKYISDDIVQNNASIINYNVNSNIFYFTKYKTINEQLIIQISNNNSNDITKLIEIKNNLDKEESKSVLKFNFTGKITEDWFELIKDKYYIKEKYKKEYIINKNYLSSTDNFYTFNNNTKSYKTNETLFTFNLCFKRIFVKLNKDILKIMNINGKDNKYVDLYLYEFENIVNDKNKIYYIDYNDEYDKYIVNNNICLQPLYNDIYLENKKQTVIYKTFNVNSINTVNVIDDNKKIITNYYRNNKNNNVCLLDLSYMINNSTNELYCNLNGKNYYSYAYYTSHNDLLREDFSNFKLKEINKSDIIINDVYGYIVKYSYNDTYTGTDKISYIEDLNIYNNYDCKYYVYDKESDFIATYFTNTYDLFDQPNIEFKLLETSYSYSYISYILDNNDTLISNNQKGEFVKYTYYDEASFNRLNKTDNNGKPLNYGKTFNYRTLSYVYVVETYEKYEFINNSEATISYNTSIKKIDDLQLYDKYNLNTYTYIDENGKQINYGFYLLELTINNTSNTLSLVNLNNKFVKYVTYINSKKITNENRNYIYNILKNIIPFIKIDPFKKFLSLDKYNVVTLPKRYQLPINYKSVKYKNYFKEKKETIINNKKEYKLNYIEHYFYDIKFNKIPYTTNKIICERYFDQIVPLFNKTSTIKMNNLKYKNINKTFNYNSFNEIYDTNLENIYNYTGINIYDISDDYIVDSKIIVDDFEYKYFNDNKFYNLIENFEIPVNKNLIYSELLYLQTEEKIFENFKNYIISNSNIQFSNDEILFLYKKYSVKCLTNSDKLTPDKKEKTYKLVYKFSLL